MRRLPTRVSKETPAASRAPLPRDAPKAEVLAPSAETLHVMRTRVAPMLAEVYPQFAEKVFGISSLSPRAGRGLG